MYVILFESLVSGVLWIRESQSSFEQQCLVLVWPEWSLKLWTLKVLRQDWVNYWDHRTKCWNTCHSIVTLNSWVWFITIILDPKRLNESKAEELIQICKKWFSAYHNLQFRWGKKIIYTYRYIYIYTHMYTHTVFTWINTDLTFFPGIRCNIYIYSVLKVLLGNIRNLLLHLTHPPFHFLWELQDICGDTKVPLPQRKEELRKSKLSGKMLSLALIPRTYPSLGNFEVPFFT